MKIKAKFKGSNSLGYENGGNYVLNFETDEFGITIKEITATRNNQTFIYRTGSYCEYTSLKSFLNNWQVF